MSVTDSKVLHNVAAEHKGSHIIVYCRLFHDIVPMNVCLLRKKELDASVWSTCSGCSVGLLQQLTREKNGR